MFEPDGDEQVLWQLKVVMIETELWPSFIWCTFAASNLLIMNFTLHLWNLMLISCVQYTFYSYGEMSSKFYKYLVPCEADHYNLIEN